MWGGVLDFWVPWCLDFGLGHPHLATPQAG